MTIDWVAPLIALVELCAGLCCFVGYRIGLMEGLRQGQDENLPTITDVNWEERTVTVANSPGVFQVGDKILVRRKH